MSGLLVLTLSLLALSLSLLALASPPKREKVAAKRRKIKPRKKIAVKPRMKIAITVAVMVAVLVGSVAFVFIGIYPSKEAPTEVVEFEEVHETYINIDASGNADYQFVMWLLPSALADAMKQAVPLIGTDVVGQSYMESVRESLAIYGLEVEDLSCEITGFGAEDNFKITLTWTTPSMARWGDNRWTIISEWVDNQSAAKEIVAGQKGSWIVIRNIATPARYRVSSRTVLLLPENARDIECPLLGSSQTTHYGGGTYSRASLSSENIGGRPAIVENDLTLIVAEEEITIKSEQLLENCLSYTVSYGGVPPENVSFAGSLDQIRLDLKYGRELDDNYSIYDGESWHSLSPAQVLYYAADAIVTIDQGSQFLIQQPISVAAPSNENGDFGAFWRTLPKTEYLNIAQQIRDNITSTAVAPSVITTQRGRIRFKDALLTFARILSSYEEGGALPSEIMLAPSPSGQLFWGNIEVPANYAYFLLPDTYVITNSHRDNQVLDDIYQPGYDNRAFANGICDWTHANIGYTLIASPPTSEWVLEHEQGQCRDYANVNLALLRTARIPARRMGGWIILTGGWQPPAGLAPFMKGETPDGETIGSHGWTQVYLPSEGWAFADPTWGYFENVPYEIYHQAEQTWMGALAGYETAYGLI